MRFLFSLCLTLLFPFLTFAQNRTCGTPSRQELMADPEIAEQMAAFDAYFQDFLKQTRANKTNEGEFLRTKYVIPTVVHVVWGHDPMGRDSLPVAQVASGFIQLFRDYRRQPETAGWGGVGVDTQIEFSLATIDPNGNPTTGVNYLYNPTLSNLDSDNEDGALKTAASWPRDQYCNVWLVNTIDGGTILGYANMGWGGGSRDGVVIGRRFWGLVGERDPSYNINRTATHELGHWLSLAHPFDGGCGSACQNSGDGICDTPAQSEALYDMGLTRTNTCLNDAGGDQPENHHNYMDYLRDAGLNHFSPQQGAKMVALLRNAAQQRRFKLWQESNLQATGTGPYKAPVAGFYAKNRRPCPGAPVQFVDFSIGLPHVFEWSFPGGTPASSTDINPVIAYTEAGNYSVTLIVKNLSGIFDTLTLDNYIQVVAETVSLPFAENFDTSSTQNFPPQHWSIMDEDNYEVLPGQANSMRESFRFYGAAKCARIRLGSYGDYGQKDGLVLPPLDLNADTAATLYFDRAYVPYRDTEVANFPLTYTDTLVVLVSDNCGSDWTEVFRKGGSELSTTGEEYALELMTQPQEGQWLRDSIALNEWAGNANVRVMFQTLNGFGNHLLLDNIEVNANNIVQKPVGRNALHTLQNLRFAPNPFANEITLRYELTENASVGFQVIDIQGKVVYQAANQHQAPGQHSQTLDLQNLPAGLYLVKTTANNRVWTNKAVKN